MTSTGPELEDHWVLRHYQAHKGAPIKGWTYRVEDGAPYPPHRILVHATAGADDRLVYLTVGLSDRPMPGSDHPEHRVELLMYASRLEPGLHDNLAVLVKYPFQGGTVFGPGHTIRGPDEGIVLGSPLTDILLTPLYFEDDAFEWIRRDDGVHVQVLCAMPVYRAERSYAVEHGWTALVDRFVEHEIDVADFARPSVVDS